MKECAIGDESALTEEGKRSDEAEDGAGDTSLAVELDTFDTPGDWIDCIDGIGEESEEGEAVFSLLWMSSLSASDSLCFSCVMMLSFSISIASERDRSVFISFSHLLRCSFCACCIPLTRDSASSAACFSTLCSFSSAFFCSSSSSINTALSSTFCCSFAISASFASMLSFSWLIVSAASFCASANLLARLSFSV